MANALRLNNIVKKYGEFVAVRNLDLEVPEGAFVSLLGASGCGKSSTLRLIAGLETADSGEIWFRGENITQLPPALRDMRMMFQDYALFPNMTLAENIEFPLTVRRNRTRFSGDRKALVKKYLDLVQMTHLADRKPHQISGGQRQRVALARALVSDPGMVLFDEPLGALDANLRHAMQFELKRIHHDQSKTFISVTHDQEEAMALSDLIALMKDGHIIQIGTPSEIYSRPNSRYVAEFIGAGSSVVDATVVRSERNGALMRLDGGIELHSELAAPNLPVGSKAGLHLRPERIGLSLTKPSDKHNVVGGTLDSFIFLGGRTEYRVALSDKNRTQITVSRSGPPQDGITEKAKVYLTFDPRSITVLDH